MRIDIVNFGEQEFRYLPMVELFIADALKKRGADGVYIHTQMNSEEFGPLMEMLCANEGPVVFWESLSSKSVSYVSNGMAFCREFTSRSDRPTFFGGYWASTVADHFPEFEIFDCIIRGYSIDVIADALMSAGPPQATVDARFPCDWNAYDLALGCLVSPGKYYRESERFLSGYISSFGCPNKCGFCYNTVLKTLKADYAARDIDKVRADIDALDALYDFKRIQFKDLNFFHETGRAFEILDFLKSRGKRIQAALDLHVQDASEEIFARMSDYGVTDIWIGLEAFSKASLAKMDKDYDTSKVARIFEWGEKHGVEVYGNVMLGAPWQTQEEVDSAIRSALAYINKYSRAHVTFNAMRPVIGTPIQKRYFPDVALGRNFREMVNILAFRISEMQANIYGTRFDFIDIEKTHKAFALINRFNHIALHSDRFGRWLLRRLSKLVQTQLKPPYFRFKSAGRLFLMEPRRYNSFYAFLRTVLVPGNRKKFVTRMFSAVASCFTGGVKA